MEGRYVLGIDLGTTNSVIAYSSLDQEQPKIELLPIPQLVAPNTIESRYSLPSFLYQARDAERENRSLALPWQQERSFAVGEWARRQAAEAPERTIAAAKSWLCHSRIDRHQPILPWQAPEEVPKASPVEVSRRYLEHIAAAWDAAFPETPIADQHVVLTVPASFDAAARELTREAALGAGLPIHFVLLEEPQAAVYAWLASLGESWRRRLAVGDTLLVCDVGGGTTDLTLVGVAEEQGELTLRRIAVGNHLLVGGDNMDLALAYYVANQFQQQGVQLDPWQSIALWHSCRAAKETLLAAEGPETHPVSILGRGSKLIGGTVSVDVQREKVAELMLDGFFPTCELGDKPHRQRASGFQDIGLPFESDTAVTRHLAAFLHAHAGAGESLVRPTHVLFNGGVFKADRFRRRLIDVLERWFQSEGGVQSLEGEQDLDYAVGRGAAYYGWAKQRGGVRIRGGTARAYYVGIETAGLAIPGVPRPLRALCVVPFGMEEGSELNVPSGEIGLVVGQPAQFRFFSSPVRKHDRVGDVLTSWAEEELFETDPLETTLSAEEIDESYVPVRFTSRVTELGVFELWCVSTKSNHRWKLEFNVREAAEN